VKIIFSPKFHSELNPIEGLWCYMKQYIRKLTDQSFKMLIDLIPLSREKYKTKQVNLKLIRRFWHCLHAYSQGKKYGEVLKIYFGNKCKENIECHRRIMSFE